MTGLRNAIWISLGLWALIFVAIAHAQQPPPPPAATPCTRTAATPPAGGPDLDAVRCQIALDAERMGQMQSQINQAMAALTLAQQDAQRAVLEKAALEQRVRDWERYAKPLYAPQDTREPTREEQERIIRQMPPTGVLNAPQSEKP